MRKPDTLGLAVSGRTAAISSELVLIFVANGDQAITINP